MTTTEERFSIAFHDQIGWVILDTYMSWLSPHTSLESAIYAYVALVYYRAPQRFMTWYAHNLRVKMFP